MTKLASSNTKSDAKISKIDMSKAIDSNNNSDKQAMSDNEVGMMEEEAEMEKGAGKKKEEVVKNVDSNRNEPPVAKPVKAVKKTVMTLKDDDGKDIGTVEMEKVTKKRKYVATLARWTHGVIAVLVLFSALMHGMHTPHTHIYTFYDYIYAISNLNVIVHKGPVWT